MATFTGRGRATTRERNPPPPGSHGTLYPNADTAQKRLRYQCEKVHTLTFNRLFARTGHNAKKKNANGKDNKKVKTSFAHGYQKETASPAKHKKNDEHAHTSVESCLASSARPPFSPDLRVPVPVIFLTAQMSSKVGWLVVGGTRSHGLSSTRLDLNPGFGF